MPRRRPMPPPEAVPRSDLHTRAGAEALAKRADTRHRKAVGHAFSRHSEDALGPLECCRRRAHRRIGGHLRTRRWLLRPELLLEGDPPLDDLRRKHARVKARRGGVSAFVGGGESARADVSSRRARACGGDEGRGLACVPSLFSFAIFRPAAASEASAARRATTSLPSALRRK